MFTVVQGPARETNALLSKYFPENVAKDQGNPFFSQIFDRWLELHKKYWEQLDPREYTLKAFQAAFQLGVSMMLEKHGY